MARTSKNPLDRNVSLRLPVALLHRLENAIEGANKGRTARSDQREDDFQARLPAFTLSDAIRKACETWLDIRENAGESATVRNLLANEFADRLVAMLALGATDKGARDHLATIAKSAASRSTVELEPETGEDFP